MEANLSVCFKTEELSRSRQGASYLVSYSEGVGAQMGPLPPWFPVLEAGGRVLGESKTFF